MWRKVTRSGKLEWGQSHYKVDLVASFPGSPRAWTKNRKNCQNSETQLCVLSIIDMQLRVVAHWWSAYTELSPLYLLSTLYVTHVRKIPGPLPLFCTASDRKLGGTWEGGYRFRCPAGQHKQSQWAAYSMKCSYAFIWSLWLKSQKLAIIWNFFVSPHRIILFLLITACDYNSLKSFWNLKVF